MVYVAGQIFLWMMLAFALGIAVGWVAHGRRGGATRPRTRRGPGPAPRRRIR